MCLILFAYKIHPEYPLILAANRDEFYARPTLAAHWWPESRELLAGKDLEAGGTWMGITKQGRIAAVTNVREPKAENRGKESRGLLPVRFLQERIEGKRFSAQLAATGDRFHGYNLIYGDLQQLSYDSNRASESIALPPGIYGISNAGLNTPWPKVERGKKRLAEVLGHTELQPVQIFEILADSELADDSELPATGVSLDWERQLSAIRITGPDYGTRTSTVLLIDTQNRVFFQEKPVAAENRPTEEFRFQIDP